VRRIAPPVHPMAARLGTVEAGASFYTAPPAGAAALGSAALASFSGAAAPDTTVVAADSAAAPETRHDRPAAVTLEEAEIEMMQNALAAAGGNISEAAKRLGISRNTIYRKLRWNKGS
jgi:sigma-54 dependent transcriptional regulator, acetoin dehydrogenase operon transcriptional activator AcoR